MNIMKAKISLKSKFSTYLLINSFKNKAEKMQNLRRYLDSNFDPLTVAIIYYHLQNALMSPLLTLDSHSFEFDSENLARSIENFVPCIYLEIVPFVAYLISLEKED